MTDDDLEQQRLADGGTAVEQATIVDPNPPAHVCGAAGCPATDDLQTIRTAAGTRTLCPTCRSGWRQRGEQR